MAEYDSIKEFLRSGWQCYTSDCSKDQKRAFRRKVSNYKLERGILYYSKVVGRNQNLPERNWRRVITSIRTLERMESCHAACSTRYNSSNYITVLKQCYTAEYIKLYYSRIQVLYN